MMMEAVSSHEEPGSICQAVSLKIPEVIHLYTGHDEIVKCQLDMAGIHYFTSRPMATIGGSGGR
jgi:hypothetical protein